MQQVKHIELKIKLLKLACDRLEQRKKLSSYRCGLCSALNDAFYGLHEAQQTPECKAAKDALQTYLSRAIGSGSAYLEEWQKKNRHRKRSVIANYNVRIQWAKWIIEQYKQIDKEQKAKK